MSQGRSSEYWFFYDRTEAALAEAKAAAERALRLRPDLPEPHVAMGYYYYWGKLDYDRALQELAQAREKQPNNAELFMASAAVQRRQGRWAGSIADFEKAVQLNPRSADAVGNLAQTYSLVRKYDLACATADKAIEITPDLSFPRWLKLQCLIGMDSLEPAKTAVRAAVQSAGVVEMSRMAAGTSAIASFAVVPNFLLIADATVQPRIEALTTADFADTAALYLLKSDVYRTRGRAALDRAYLDSARTVLESQVKAHPEEANFHARLGLVYANQGRKTDAVREGESAVKLLPVSREAYRGANIQAALALIYATVGMRSEAVDQLKYLLSVPSELSVGLLRHDPRWAPLRGDTRFEELLTGKR